MCIRDSQKKKVWIRGYTNVAELYFDVLSVDHDPRGIRWYLEWISR